MPWNELNTEESLSELNHTLPWVENEFLWESPRLGNWRSPSTSAINKTMGMESLMSNAEAMSEETCDQCISDIFQGCSVTDECVELFMEKMYSRYSLTHQLFYFHFAEKVRTNTKLSLRNDSCLKCVEAVKPNLYIFTPNFTLHLEKLFQWRTLHKEVGW